MRRWRVGTLSMGFLLVAVGVMLLIAQINQKAVFDLILKWWPVVLLLLGGEVLWYSYSAKEEHPKVRYDVFSIFIISVIILSGVGLYALTEIGILPQIRSLVSSVNYDLTSSFEEIPLDSNIKKIVIDAPRVNLVVRTEESSTVLAGASGQARADSRENAQKLMSEQGVMHHQSGDTLYLSFLESFSNSGIGYHARVWEFNLVIPGDRKVEIRKGSSVQIFADGLKGNLVVNGSGETMIQFPQDADARVVASSDHQIDFRGNVEWKIDREEASDEATSARARGEVSLGKGTYKINIIGGDLVTVNQTE